MNDTKSKKIIIIGVFISLLLCLLIQSIVDHKVIRRANLEVDRLERKLDNAKSRIADCSRELTGCRETVNECSDTVGRIAKRLNGYADTLQDVITNLRLVRKEVVDMENALNNFYDKYGYIDRDYNIYDEGVEE